MPLPGEWTPPDPLPTVGRIVHYVSETGRYYCAALVVGTVDNVDPDLRAEALEAIHQHAGDHTPDASEIPEAVTHPARVHLRVLPAGPGPEYYEPNVPYDAEGLVPCSWRYPPRV